MHALQEFIEKNLDKGLNWGEFGLSYNPSVTMDIVQKYIDKPWNWGYWGLSRNPNVTPEFIEKHIDKPWDWEEGLSSNPCLTTDFIEKHINRRWGWTILWSNPCLTVDFIEKHIEILKPFNWKCLSYNPNITIDFIEKYIDKAWDWISLGANPVVTLDFVEKYMDKFFQEDSEDYTGVADNKNITLEFIEKHKDKFHKKIINHLIPLDQCKNPKELRWGKPKECYEWSNSGMSSNPNITPEFLEKHKNKKWDWEEIIVNHPAIPCEEFVKHVDKVKEYNKRREWISSSKKLTESFVEKNMDLKAKDGESIWDSYSLLRNPNISPEFVYKHVDFFKYNNYDTDINIYGELCSNPMC